MGSVVNNIAQGAQNFVRNPGEELGRRFRDIGESTLGNANLIPLGLARPYISEMMKKKPPGQVQTDDAAENIRKEQARQYQTFQQNMPSIQKQMQERLASQANLRAAQGQRQSQEKMSSRGLGYGGLNEAMKQQVTAQEQQRLAGQVGDVNRGLLDLGEQLRTGAIGTGQGIQGQLQQRQDQLFQQQMAKYNADQAIAGNVIGTGLGAAIMLGKSNDKRGTDFLGTNDSLDKKRGLLWVGFLN